MVRNQKGFTIIELVVVIVILGILAAVAFPKFQDLSGSAKLAVVNGGVAAFKSAAVITLAKNAGTIPTAASVIAQTTAESVSFVGTCPGPISAQYTTDTAVSVSFTMDATVCNN
jgi:MSHA pilin protein MshA